MLKSFGLALAMIKRCLNDQKCFEKVFNERYEILTKEKAKIDTKLKRLDEYLSNLKSDKSIISPKIKIVKPFYIYAFEKTGRYVDIKNFDKELGELIGDTKFRFPYVTIFKDQDFLPEKCRMIIGAVVGSKKPKENKEVEIRRIDGYKALTYVHIGSYSYLSFIWQFLNKYVKEHNLKLDPKNSDREFYLRGSLVESNEDNLVTELQIPIL